MFNRNILSKLCVSLFAVMLCVNLAAQLKSTDGKISIKLEKVTVQKAMQHLGNNFDYSFSINANNIDLGRVISIDVKDADITEVLSKIFVDQNVIFKIEGHTIIVEKGTRTISVSGVVYEPTGEPAIGAAVFEVGNLSNGVITDIDGKFSIEVGPTAFIEASSLGFAPAKVSVSGQTLINITLGEDKNYLDEVVIVGYGTVKKRDLTGSVSSVKGEKLTEFVTSSAVQALQGRVAGVVITSNNGSPDAPITVRIRGNNSIQGSNDPLYIIDGIPQDMSSINSWDIESIEVLKDASATAIYGSRGANGVVLVSTKKGSAGKTQVDYNFECGFQSRIAKMPLMNSAQSAEATNLNRANSGLGRWYSDEAIAKYADHSDLYNYPDTDWQDLMFRTAPVLSHNVSVRGGTDKTKIFVSGSFLDKDGIIIESFYRKTNIRTNIDHELNKWLKAGVTMAYTNTDFNDIEKNGTSVVEKIYTTSPIVKPVNADGSYADIGDADIPGVFPGATIYNHLKEYSSIRYGNIFDINGYLSLCPLKDLEIKSTLGYESGNTRNDTYQSRLHLSGDNYARINHAYSRTMVNENTINFRKEMGDHSLNMVAGFTYQSSRYEMFSQGAGEFISDATYVYNLSGAGYQSNNSSSETSWTMLSYLGRINYSYKGRYLLTASFRADGSSRYSEGSKWGYFPSFALAWRVCDEQWMKDISSISDLKLRAGWGRTGSTAISPYQTQNLLFSGTVACGNDIQTYYAVGDSYPGDLRWESTAQWNVGFDFAMYKNRLRLTADYYAKLTTDLLNNVIFPYSSGFDSALRNIGEMSNKGFELTLEGDIFQTRDFSWTTSFNIALNRNKVNKLYGGEDIHYAPSIIREGEALGVFWGYKEDGYTNNGAIKYVDVDSDGHRDIIKDGFIIGDPNPDFTYGLISDIYWKGFELNFFLQGVQGNDVYNMTAMSMVPVDIIQNSWSKFNTDAKYPKYSSSTFVYYNSDRFVEDGSYLRCKNLSIAYNLPLDKMGGIGHIFRSARVYLSAQNLFTITKYSGVDPEVNSYGSDINFGIDNMSYPNYRTFSMGVNLKF